MRGSAPVTTFHHKIHLDDADPEQYARRREHLAWQHYLRSARVLANTPIRDAWDARMRVEAAKAEFAEAWRALDGVIQ
jgi:hypothetical protein